MLKICNVLKCKKKNICQESAKCIKHCDFTTHLHCKYTKCTDILKFCGDYCARHCTIRINYDTIQKDHYTNQKNHVNHCNYLGCDTLKELCKKHVN